MTREELLKIAKPVLFNTEMVIAILEDRKTATRRIVKPQPQGYFEVNDNPLYIYDSNLPPARIAPLIQAGDYLYVRETWCNWADDIGNNFFYKATDDGVDGFSPKWKPSIHMPKEAARIFLKVTDVRVERLQDMVKEDFEKEGVIDICDGCGTPRDFCDCCGGLEEEFIGLWDSTIKKADLDKYGWEANPYVWVIEFERVEV